MEQISLNDLAEKVDYLTKLVESQIVDEDCLLSKDDILAIEQGRKEFREGRAISGDQLKKELGYVC